MTKQEKLENWINKYLTERFIAPFNTLPEDECRGEARAIISYLHSQGVVIKGDELQPCVPHLGDYFTVELLIDEEEK